MSARPHARPQADAVTVLLAVIGALLLLPGLYAIIVGVAAIAGEPRASARPPRDVFALFFGVGLMVLLGGTALLWVARRRWRRGGPSG